MNFSLYELTNIKREIMDGLEYFNMNKEEIAPEKKLRLILIQGIIDRYFEEKNASLIEILKDLEHLKSGYESEEKRLKELKAEADLKIEGLKRAMKNSMQSLELKKVVTPKGTISLRKSPISVEVLNVEKVDDEFKKTTIKVDVDKIKVKKFFEETGALPDGIKIHKNNFNIIIK